MPQSDFAWKFPCYVLAQDFDRDAETGAVRLTAGTQIFAPRVSGDDEQHVALFTDADAATAFQEQVPSTVAMELLQFAVPEELKSFFKAVGGQFSYAVIDLNPQTRVCRSFAVEEILTALDCWTRESDSS